MQFLILQKSSFEVASKDELVEIVDHEPHITWFAAFTTYLGYAVLILLGRIRDLIGVWIGELAAPQPAPKVTETLIMVVTAFLCAITPLDTCPWTLTRAWRL